MSFLRVKLSYSVKEVLSEDAVRDSASWSKSLSALAGTRARSKKAD